MSLMSIEPQAYFLISFNVGVLARVAHDLSRQAAGVANHQGGGNTVGLECSS